MASHFRLGNGPAPLMTGQAVSGTTVYTSSTFRILNLDNVGIQIKARGTMNGTFDLQVSADHQEDELGNVIVAGSWISKPLPTTPTLSGSDADIYLELNQLSAPWCRVVYTNSSSTGTISLFGCGKAMM